MRTFPAILILLIAVSLTACGDRHGTSAPVPRPEAYPRIEMPDSSFTTFRTAGMEMAVNAGAEAESTLRPDGSRWITISYPGGVNTKVYLTLSTATSTDSTAAITANRRERMALNLSGAEGLLTTLTSEGGWDCEMVTSREALSTPVQILARKNNLILSGSLYMQLSPSTAPDSVAPVIDAIDRDMLTLLKSLR